MALDLTTVQTGMDVMDPTGNKIGTIADIIDVQAYSATETDTTYTNPATGSAVDDDTVTMAPASGNQRYLKVDHGGILGIGAQHLYIPFTAVQNVVPGESLTVNCTSDTCGDMYGTKPDFLP